MKKLLFIIFLSTTCSAYGQIKSGSSWLSENLGGIKFYTDEVLFDFTGSQQSKKYYMSKDTLIMIDSYTTSADNFTKRHINLYKFRATITDTKTLSLIPVNDNANKLCEGFNMEFRNIDYVKDSSIKFTHIHLNTGMCFGFCPVLSIDINSNGTYYLRGDENADNHVGYFKGRLSSAQLDTLNSLIQHSQVEKMQHWKQKIEVSDAPPYNLTVYYNDKKLIVNTNWPPLVIRDLLDFLTTSYKRVQFVPDKEKHEFKEDDGMKYH